MMSQAVSWVPRIEKKKYIKFLFSWSLHSGGERQVIKCQGVRSANKKNKRVREKGGAILERLNRVGLSEVAFKQRPE